MRYFAKALILPAVLIAVPAAAQDAEPFTGPSIVALGGVDHSNGGSNDPTGFVYGGAVTYDLGSGSLRYGVEAEVTGTTTGNCYTSTSGATSVRNCYDMGRDLYAGARIGAVVAPNLMVYGICKWKDRQEISETVSVPLPLLNLILDRAMKRPPQIKITVSTGAGASGYRRGTRAGEW